MPSNSRIINIMPSIEIDSGNSEVRSGITEHVRRQIDEWGGPLFVPNPSSVISPTYLYDDWYSDNNVYGNIAEAIRSYLDKNSVIKNQKHDVHITYNSKKHIYSLYINNVFIADFDE